MIAIILNETAGNGRAKKQWQQIEAYLQKEAIDYRLYKTEYAGHATALARQAAGEGAQIVFSMGGDGLAQEVVRGLYGTGAAMGILPAGTGNDFIKSLGLPKEPLGALKQALSRPPQPIDIGLINGQAFLNIAGAGFDVKTLAWSRRFKWLPGSMMPYLLGALCAIVTFQPLDAEITRDGETYHQRAIILAVSNGQYLGGGMRLAPHASIRDGLFDVVTISQIPRFLLLFLLPFVIAGHGDRLKPITTCRCQSITLRQKGLVMEADGEFFPGDELTLQVVPGGIKMAM